MKLDELTLKEFDKNTKMMPLTFDVMFKSVFTRNLEILKYLEFYYRLYYNEPKKRTRDVIWLAALNAKTFSELYDMLKQIVDKKKLDRFMKDVINMSIENFNLHDWMREEFDEYIALKKEEMELKKLEEAGRIGMERGMKQGLVKGIEQGIEQGIEKGIEQGNEEATNNIIKEMLKKTFSLNDIKDITGKSIEEIKQIKKSLVS